MATLAEASAKAIAAHGIGDGVAPKLPELWEQFKSYPQTVRVSLSIENRFFAGYEHEQLDWSRPVHALFVDFKGDSMQLGMLLQRLHQRGDQYVFVAGDTPAFNGGWHFTAVNDFEHPAEQQHLDGSWHNVRIWTRVNYICTTSSDGAPALTPRDAFKPKEKHAGAVPVGPGMLFASLYFTGGLMPHTINATAVADGGPMGLVIAEHLQRGATFAAVGHGLDVLIACGTPEQSLVAGFEAAAFPKQDHLLEISGMHRARGPVSSSRGPTGAMLVSASCWGASAVGSWFEAAGLAMSPAGASSVDAARFHTVVTVEPVLRLDVATLPKMVGAAFSGKTGTGAPQVAVFVDDVADPVEAFTIVSHLMQANIGFHLISHSVDIHGGEHGMNLRVVTTETVFGNPMYGLRECVCELPTTPANLVPAGTHFDSFFVAGGQCPYQLMQDAAVTAIMDQADIAAVVCHGPEALIGSKWMRSGRFTAYYGCWMSFRHVLDRFERKRPGEICRDGRLFSGNAPNSTKDMVVQACGAILELRRG